MNSNLYFLISGIFFVVLLLKTYFSKKRLVSIENNIYISLVVANLIGLLLNTLSVWTILNFGANSFLSVLSGKIYLLSVLAWLTILTVYIYLISYKKAERIEKVDKLSLKKIFTKLIPVGIVFLIGLFALSITSVKEVNIVFYEGLGVYFVYAISVICIILWGYRYVTRVMYIRRRKSNIILLAVVFGMLTLALQIAYPQLLFITFIMYFLTFAIYFNIDNPDLDLMYKLDLARKQVEEAEVSKTDALMKASHEIRTPLNTIVGFSQSILEGSLDNIEEDIEHIKTASKNLLNTVNNILDIPNADAQELKLLYDEYNVDMLMKQIVALSKTKFEGKKVEFRVNIEEKLPSVLYGDSIRIKQIILNILYNAIKHTKEGYVSLKVGSVKIGNICRLVVSVKDTGIGISEERYNQLFDEKKVSTKKVKEGDLDLDLNLAIIKKIVESMNGQIVVESEYREGTLVRISIDQKIVESKTTNQEESAEANKTDFSGKRVLVVDDDKINLKVAVRLLKNYNVEIDQVSSGLNCLQKINDGEKYDLIFLDDWMPNMSGVDTLKQLDKVDNFNTPVVALTANAVSGMKEKYLDQGFNDFISKPIEREELDRVVQKFLND